MSPTKSSAPENQPQIHSEQLIQPIVHRPRRWRLPETLGWMVRENILRVEDFDLPHLCHARRWTGGGSAFHARWLPLHSGFVRRFAESRPNIPPYDLPGTQLFWDFCNDTIKRGQLKDKFVQTAITAIGEIDQKKEKKDNFPQRYPRYKFCVQH